MTISINGGYRHANGKFHYMVNPSGTMSDGTPVAFKDRGPGRPVVVGVNDGGGDQRQKLFLDRTDLDGEFVINGVAVNLPHRGDGLYQGDVGRASNRRIMYEGPNVTMGTSDEPRDYCIETRFDTDTFSRSHNGHPGDVTGFPEWMMVTDIVVTAEVNGSGPCVYLSTDLDAKHPHFADMLHGVRINGVWCTGMPFQTGGEVHLMFPVTPDDAREIRGYGDGLTDLDMPDETRPIRTRHLVRALWNHLKARGLQGGMDAWEWRDDVMKMQYRVMGMGVAYGQWSVFNRKLDEVKGRIRHWEGLMVRRYQKRPKAYESYSMDAWINEVGGAPAYWRRRVDELRGVSSDIAGDLTRFNEAYMRQLRDYQERLARVEKREERWAAAIAEIHPRA